MAASTKGCGICHLRYMTKPVLVWCIECDEGLCTECKEHHSLSKASRSHCVIPFNEYQKLPADLLKNTQYCTKHDKKYQMYCQKHACPCCSKCKAESHNECGDFVELDDVSHNVKISNAMLEIEESLVEIENNLKKIRQHQQDNLTTLTKNRKEIEIEIKKKRMQINNHLDTLQEDLLKKLYEEEKKENSKICQVLSTLEKKEKEIVECQKNIMNIKQHATDLQVFLLMKKIEEDVYSENKFLQSLGEDKNFNQISLSYKINTSITNIISDITTFGKVCVEEKSCNIVFIWKRSQIVVPTVPSKSIENVTPVKYKTIDTKLRQTYGCCLLPDGKMAFTSYKSQAIDIFGNDGLKDFAILMPFVVQPHDIVCNCEDNTLAVTSGKSPQMCITIIDLEKKQIKKTIPQDTLTFGIALTDNRLICCGRGKGIRMINLHDDSVSDIVLDAYLPECNTATFRDNIYYTNYKANTVTCYNLQGIQQWKFHNEKVLTKPKGIDVDSDGIVYVVGFDSNNLVVISPDGKSHRELLTAVDGLHYPNSIHYSRPTNQLLVANYVRIVNAFNIIETSLQLKPLAL